MNEASTTQVGEQWIGQGGQEAVSQGAGREPLPLAEPTQYGALAGGRGATFRDPEPEAPGQFLPCHSQGHIVRSRSLSSGFCEKSAV